MFHVFMIFLDGTLSSNVAIRKPAKQSSTDVYSASNAVDGNTGSCSRTRKQRGSWWEVEVGDLYEIRHVEIVSRGDCCCKLHNTP